jgi:hypothetical protein
VLGSPVAAVACDAHRRGGIVGLIDWSLAPHERQIVGVA